MEKKKIKFDGMTNPYTNKLNWEASIMLKILQKHYEVELSDEPDYIIYSVDSENYYKYDCVRIFFTIEALCPDFNMADYGIGFEYMTYGDRYLRLPNFAFYPDIVNKMICKHENVEDNLSDRAFCSFVYSNAKAAPMREKLFKCLNAYKKVDSGGKYLNNMPDGKNVDNKAEFEANHKFSIACENATHPGYHTEKLIEAFAAKTIPIYWGDPVVGEVFNKKAYIDVNDYSFLDDVCASVKELDENSEKYLQMLREPALRDNTVIGKQYQQGLLEELEKYFVFIMEQPLEQCYRRNRGFWGEQYTVMLSKEKNILQKYNKLRNNPILRIVKNR